MKLSELKITDDCPYVKQIEKVMPDLKDAIVEDYEVAHQSLLNSPGMNQEIPEDQLDKYKMANDNYFLYFFHGVVSILDPQSYINEAYRKLQDKQAQNLVGKMLNKNVNSNKQKDN